MFGFNAGELVIILIIVLILFGPGKLPQFMNDMGRGVRSFKKAMEEPEESLNNPTTPTTTAANPPEKPAATIGSEVKKENP